jgi:ABC-type transport system substrate-binding protein
LRSLLPPTRPQPRPSATPSRGDLDALDPYTLDESFTLGAVGDVMERLTKRDKGLEIVPGLAVRREIVDPLEWRFHLRKGVKFHNGEDFTAEAYRINYEEAGVIPLHRQALVWGVSDRSTSCSGPTTRSCSTG